MSIFWLGHTNILRVHHLSIDSHTQSLMKRMMDTLGQFVTEGHVDWSVYTTIEDAYIFE